MTTMVNIDIYSNYVRIGFYEILDDILFENKDVDIPKNILSQIKDNVMKECSDPNNITITQINQTLRNLRLTKYKEYNLRILNAMKQDNAFKLTNKENRMVKMLFVEILYDYKKMRMRTNFHHYYLPKIFILHKILEILHKVFNKINDFELYSKTYFTDVASAINDIRWQQFNKASSGKYIIVTECYDNKNLPVDVSEWKNSLVNSI